MAKPVVFGAETRASLVHIRAALFILATMLLAVCAALLPLFPQPTHAVPLDLIDEHLQRRLLVGSQIHRLEVDRDGNMVFDGTRLCDLIALRQRLDFIMLSEEPILEILPDPELRYETVIEIIAVAGRASVRNLQVELQPTRANRWPAYHRPVTCRERYVL